MIHATIRGILCTKGGAYQLKIKPCPCCGGEADIVEEGSTIRVRCTRCELQTKKFDARTNYEWFIGRHNAIIRWNCRK